MQLLPCICTSLCSKWRLGCASHCLKALTKIGMPAEFLPDNPYDTLSEGCDFARNHMPDNIDYAAIHLWPDSWLSGGQCSEEAALRFARRWINSHVDCCARLGKPLVLTEFGKKPAGPPRATFYQKVSAPHRSRAAKAVASSKFFSLEQGASVAKHLRCHQYCPPFPFPPLVGFPLAPSNHVEPKGPRRKALDATLAEACLATGV